MGWRNNAVFVLLLTMLGALFFSRALLSISMMGLLAVTLVHKQIGRQAKAFLENRFLVAIALLFVAPMVSGLWSSNTEEWASVMRIKLPLLFFPLAFAGGWQLSEKQWRWIGYTFLGLTVGATLWSLAQYLGHMQEVHEGYLRSKIIVTPLKNDHVRFSWMVSVAVLTCLVFLHSSVERFIKTGLVLAAAWMAVYLHILTARTGLLSFYLIIFLYVAWLLVRWRAQKVAVLGTIVLMALPVLAWLVLPTFQNRVRYMIYDLSHVQEQKYLPGSNDGSRVMSLRAGWDILQEHPLGVGMGDVKDEAYRWYDQNIPGIQASDKIDPSSEWLIYGDALGWIGVLLFTLCMILPLLEQVPRYRFFWVVLNLTAAFSFLFDIGLEGQYGVFLYVFLVFGGWKWMRGREDVRC